MLQEAARDMARTSLTAGPRSAPGLKMMTEDTQVIPNTICGTVDTKFLASVRRNMGLSFQKAAHKYSQLAIIDWAFHRIAASFITFCRIRSSSFHCFQSLSSSTASSEDVMPGSSHIPKLLGALSTNPILLYNFLAGASASSEIKAPGGALSLILVSIRCNKVSPNPLRWCAGSTAMSARWKYHPPSPMVRSIPTTSGSGGTLLVEEGEVSV